MFMMILLLLLYDGRKTVDEPFVQHLLHFSFVKQIKPFSKKQTYRTLRISLSIRKFVSFDLLLFILTCCNSFFTQCGSFLTRCNAILIRRDSL